MLFVQCLEVNMVCVKDFSELLDLAEVEVLIVFVEFLLEELDAEVDLFLLHVEVDVASLIHVMH